MCEQSYIILNVGWGRTHRRQRQTAPTRAFPQSARGVTRDITVKCTVRGALVAVQGELRPVRHLRDQHAPLAGGRHPLLDRRHKHFLVLLVHPVERYVNIWPGTPPRGSCAPCRPRHQTQTGCVHKRRAYHEADSEGFQSQPHSSCSRSACMLAQLHGFLFLC